MPDIVGWFNIGSFLLQLPALAIARQSLSKSNDDLQSQSLSDMVEYTKDIGEFECFLEEKEIQKWNERFKSCVMMIEEASVEHSFPYNWLQGRKVLKASELARKLRLDFKSRSLDIQARRRGMYRHASASEMLVLNAHQSRRVGIADGGDVIDESDAGTLAGINPSDTQLQDLGPGGLREPV